MLAVAVCPLRRQPEARVSVADCVILQTSTTPRFFVFSVRLGVEAEYDENGEMPFGCTS